MDYLFILFVDKCSSQHLRTSDAIINPSVATGIPGDSRPARPIASVIDFTVLKQGHDVKTCCVICFFFCSHDIQKGKYHEKHRILSNTANMAKVMVFEIINGFCGFSLTLGNLFLESETIVIIFVYKLK